MLVHSARQPTSLAVSRAHGALSTSATADELRATACTLRDHNPQALLQDACIQKESARQIHASTFMTMPVLCRPGISVAVVAA